MWFINALEAPRALACTRIYCLLENLADREQIFFAWIEVQHLEFWSGLGIDAGAAATLAGLAGLCFVLAGFMFLELLLERLVAR
jgi:hypothetical protein